MQTAYNKYGFYFFVGTMLVSTVWVCYFIFFYNFIDLGEVSEATSQPAVATGLSEEEQKSPWVSTENLVAHGSKVYKAQCALCHGAKGLGDGTPGLIPPPRNLVEGKWKQGGSSKDLFITLEAGVPNTSMVSFKHLPAIDRWALVHYVRSITQNKVSDNVQELEKFGQTTL